MGGMLIGFLLLWPPDKFFLFQFRHFFDFSIFFEKRSRVVPAHTIHEKNQKFWLIIK